MPSKHSNAEELTIDHEILKRVEQIENLQRELAALRSRRNERIPTVSHFPNEVLAEIFLYVALDMKEWYACHWRSCTYLEWMAVAHVCRHWRKVALNLPRFWTRIPMSAGSRRAENILSLSRNSPLTIEAGKEDRISHDHPHVLSVLEKAAERLLKVFLTIIDWEIAHLHTPFGVVLPQLEVLQITYNRGHPHAYIPQNRFWILSGAHLPRLTTLRLMHLPLDFVATLLRPTLAHLYVNAKHYQSYAEDWLEALQHLPLLETLALHNAITKTHVVQADLEAPAWRVPLSRLQRLEFDEIVDIGTAAMNLTNHLHLPAQCCVSLESAGGPRTDLENRFIFKVLREHLSRQDPATGLAHLPFSCIIKLCDYYSMARMWPSLVNFDAYYSGVEWHAEEVNQVAPTVDIIADHGTLVDAIEETPLEGTLRWFPLLPLSNLRVLHVVQGEHILSAEDHRGLFTDCVQVEELSYECQDPTMLMDALTDTDALLFPRLRSLTLHGVQWHAHTATCAMPFDGEPFSRHIEGMLAAREAFGRPVTALHLKEVSALDPRPGKDLEWLQKMRNELLVLTCERLADDPDLPCAACDADEEQTARTESPDDGLAME